MRLIGYEINVRSEYYSLQIVYIITMQSIKNGVNRFYVIIVPTLKSMIPMTLKHQNWVEPLSGSKIFQVFLRYFMDIITD